MRCAMVHTRHEGDVRRFDAPPVGPAAGLPAQLRSPPGQRAGSGCGNRVVGRENRMSGIRRGLKRRAGGQAQRGKALKGLRV